MHILIGFILLCFTWAYAEEPIVINITTENQLLPLYLAPFIQDNSGFSQEYVKKLEEILRYDLNFNGMTYVAKPNKVISTFESAFWKTEHIYYVVQATVLEKSLSAKLFIVSQNAFKKVEGISVTGILSEDRKKIHKLADAIYKTLFQQDGIASTHLLYTVKVKNSAKAASEVIHCDYDGGNPRILTDQKTLCVSPCFIPAKPGFISKNFAFVSYKTGQPKIYFSTFDENKETRFSLIKGNQFMPAFSPACNKIAFICDVTGNPDLFVQSLDEDKGPLGKPMQLFSANYGTQASPTFNSDGSKIAFVSNKDGAPRIYVTTLPTNAGQKAQAILLTKKNRENTSPCWSPDGSKIVYSALTKGVRQIWVYDFTTGEEKQITEGSFHKENPTFAPNSTHIAYNSNEGDQSEIFIINLRQPKALKITSGKGDKRFPSWNK